MARRAEYRVSVACVNLRQCVSAASLDGRGGGERCDCVW